MKLEIYFQRYWSEKNAKRMDWSLTAKSERVESNELVFGWQSEFYIFRDFFFLPNQINKPTMLLLTSARNHTRPRSRLKIYYLESTVHSRDFACPCSSPLSTFQPSPFLPSGGRFRDRAEFRKLILTKRYNI